MAYTKEGTIGFMEKHYESNLKGANLLLVAHGAALLACLSTLKDYDATARLHGVGLYIVLFGFGLVAAILYYISLSFSRAVVMNALMDETEAEPDTKRAITILNVSSLVVSLGCLIVALLTISVHFARL